MLLLDALLLQVLGRCLCLAFLLWIYSINLMPDSLCACRLLGRYAGLEAFEHLTPTLQELLLPDLRLKLPFAFIPVR